jgi:protein-tyrosine-phosphatase
MDVLKFKKTGDVYFVQYEENKDIKTIKTEDEPESELITAMDNVALALLKLFDLEGSCKLFSTEWKDGEKAGSKCVLLSGESSVYGPIKVFLPKVSTQEAEEEGIYDPENLKNKYNEAVDHLREIAKRFVQGARKQRTLPFPEEPKTGKKKRGIVGTAADKVTGLFKGAQGDHNDN